MEEHPWIIFLGGSPIILGGSPDTLPLLQDVLLKVVRYEGFFSLWKGFTPYYARLGPHTVLTFIFLEQMNKWYQRLFLSA